MKLKGLGRGLDALLAGNETQSREQQRTLPVANLQPGKYQPRTQMDRTSLEELAASIRAQGLMQPILVRPIGGTLGEDPPTAHPYRRVGTGQEWSPVLGDVPVGQ